MRGAMGAAVLLTLLVAGVAVGIGSSIWGVEKPPAAQLETFKTLLQVVLVGALVKGLSIVADDFQARRKDSQLEQDRQSQRNAAHHQRREGVFRRIVENYGAAKKLRRLLRAKRAPEELFERLNDVQLQFETILKEVSKTTLFSEQDVIDKGLRSMERYLGHVIDDIRGTDKPGVKGTLDDFTATQKDSNFQREFAHPFDAVLDVMKRDLIASDPSKADENRAKVKAAPRASASVVGS